MCARGAGRLVLALGFMLLPVTAWPQAALSGGIAGVVRDTTGAVLPGVTVEASSPALIEKARFVITDNQGQYKIVELRPGTYAVTFTLPGFSRVRREGVELATGFTAAVNAELSVGLLAETITVSGASPVVDVQNTQPQVVLQRAELDSLPTAKSFASYQALIPGVSGGNTVQGNLFADYSGRGLDSNNLTDDLRARGLNSYLPDRQLGGHGGGLHAVLHYSASQFAPPGRRRISGVRTLRRVARSVRSGPESGDLCTGSQQRVRRLRRQPQCPVWQGWSAPRGVRQWPDGHRQLRDTGCASTVLPANGSFQGADGHQGFGCVPLEQPVRSAVVECDRHPGGACVEVQRPTRLLRRPARGCDIATTTPPRGPSHLSRELWQVWRPCAARL